MCFLLNHTPFHDKLSISLLFLLFVLLSDAKTLFSRGLQIQGQPWDSKCWRHLSQVSTWHIMFGSECSNQLLFLFTFSLTHLDTWMKQRNWKAHKSSAHLYFSCSHIHSVIHKADVQVKIQLILSSVKLEPEDMSLAVVLCGFYNTIRIIYLSNMWKVREVNHNNTQPPYN